jgi:ArsR family transcriptional regulator
MENELSLALRWVRGQIADLLDRLQTAVGTETDAQFHADLLAAVVSTDGSRRQVVADVDAPAGEVRRGLDRLVDAGVLAFDGDRYRVVD